MLKTLSHPGLRIAAALAALLFLGTLTPRPIPSRAPFVHRATIRFDPVPLDENAPERRRLGRLVYLAGWSLSSDNGRFGGISAMHVADGRVTALSDTGWLIRFALPRRGASVEGRIDPLPQGPGSPAVKRDRDSEALAIEGDHAWVAFERQDAVWRYRTTDWRSDAHARPPAMARWSNNAGSEGMARLSDGRFLIFAESGWRRDGTSEVLLFDGDPALPGARYSSLGFRPPPGYRLTDAAALPDGRLLLLTRRASLWTGVGAKLLLAALPARGDRIEGELIATLRTPVTVDNMEALSVTREQGRTIVWMASDDNFNPLLQRTLLLKFMLAE